MKPIATDFGDVHLPPTDPLYVEGAPGGQVPRCPAWTWIRRVSA